MLFVAAVTQEDVLLVLAKKNGVNAVNNEKLLKEPLSVEDEIECGI